MSDINLVIFSGRLTSKPEMRLVNLGGAKGTTSVLDLSIASNRVFKDETRKTVFAKVTLWGTQAEYWSATGAGNLNKGDCVLVEGMLSDDNYEKDGEKTFGRTKIDHVTSFSIVARNNDETKVFVGESDNTEDLVQ